MRKIQKISKKIIIAFVILILTMNFYVYADSQEVGTINFIAINNSNSEKVSNLEVKVYQIGKSVDGEFVFNEAYNGVDINDYSKSNIESIENIAVQNDKPLFTKSTDEDGKIDFKNIDIGVYLFVQSNNKENFEMQTMLVKVPEATGDKVEYNITIKPKIVNIKKETEEKLDDKIPYTGTLNWPIPVLAGASLIVFSIGWIVYYSGKNKKKIN